MKAKLLLGAASLLFSVTIALVAGELFVRWKLPTGTGTPYVAENPDTAYFSRPHVAGRMASPGEFEIEFHTNARGLRSTDVPYTRTAASRALCMGDSFTFGIGGNDDESWPSVLQKQLSQRAQRPWEVINAGVMGWGLAEYAVWFEVEGAKYRPDRVIIGVHASDWENASNGLWVRDSEGNLSRKPLVRRDVARLKRLVEQIPFYDWLMTHSQLANRIKVAFVQRTQQGVNVRERAAGATADHLRERFERLRPLNEALLARIAARTASAGGKLELVYIPKVQELDPKRTALEEGDLVRPWLMSWAARNGIATVDGLKVLGDELSAGTKVEELYFLRDGHCRPRAYRTLGEAVAKQLNH